MTYHLNKDTLAGIKLSALFEKRNSSNVLLQCPVSAINDFKDKEPGTISPDAEAFKFYYANHVWSLILAKYGQHETLPSEIAKLARSYVKLSSDLVVRAVYYSILICVREARHLYKNSQTYDKLEAAHGAKFITFLKKICGVGEDGAQHILCTDPPKITFGTFASGVTDLFNPEIGSFSGGYGGTPWMNVADTVRKLVYGEITPEMFADTVFTLAHNGGPIFNKGMFYSHWTNFLYKILDVQRAGMVPQLQAEGAVSNSFMSTELKEFIVDAKAAFPEELGGYVDWHLVAKFAPGNRQHSYEKEKKNQVMKYAPTPDMIAEAKLEKQKYYVGIGAQDYALMIERDKIAA